MAFLHLADLVRNEGARTRLSWIVAIEISLIMVIASFHLPGGDDLHSYFLPFAKGCLRCGFLPYYALWLLWPLAHLPTALAWPIWTAFSLCGWLLVCRHTKANPALALLAFPALGQMWLGQIDVLIAAGLVLALRGTNAYLRGAGILLALIKPQLSLLALLVLLISERERTKMLAIPALAAIASLIAFGIGWPLEWCASAVFHLPASGWREAAMDVWPAGLLLVWLPFVLNDNLKRMEAGLLVGAIATPFVGVYSYLAFLAFGRKEWWTVPLSYAWLGLLPFWGRGAMRVAWVLPAALLAQLVYDRFIRAALPVKPGRSESAVGADLGRRG